MSRIKLFLDVVEDVRTLANSLQTMANAIVSEDAEPEPQTTAAVSPTEETVTLEQVRAVLVKKKQEGFIEQVHGLIQKYGAQKLGAVDPGHYADLMRDAEELTNAGT